MKFKLIYSLILLSFATASYSYETKQLIDLHGAVHQYNETLGPLQQHLYISSTESQDGKIGVVTFEQGGQCKATLKRPTDPSNRVLSVLCADATLSLIHI